MASKRRGKPASEPAEAPLGPCIVVIFGVSGDLAKRKLLPALYNLAAQRRLPQKFAVIGIARRDIPEETFRNYLRKEVRPLLSGRIDEAVWKDLVRRCFFVPGDFDDSHTYVRLRERLGKLDRQFETGGNVVFYLATASEYFAPVVEHCEKAGLSKEKEAFFRRFVVEKPFGRDLESARALNHRLRRVLRERQIYRIDHYLGKETVQNLLVFRFGNGIFEPIWNRRYVDHVQITVAEDLGVEQRGGYYEDSGALRDMIPNHMCQLLSLTAMEPPISFQADAVRDEQSKVLRAVAPLTPESVLERCVRGQYGAGVLDRKKVPGYRSEPRVAPKSSTETFVALKLFVDSWRWADVPFYLRTGKRLPCRATEIVIQFKRVPLMLFRQVPVEHVSRNQLVIRIQPDEGIALSFQAKVPGTSVRIGSVDMNFRYHDYFGERPATGYERLLHDCMSGDATLFQREDMLEAAWSVVAPIQEVWKALPARGFPNYAAGTWGPKEAESMMTQDGRRWRGCGA